MLNNKVMAFFGAFGEVIFLFGLFGWLYGVTIQITNPEWLTIQISHLTPWLRVDVFTIISFIASALGFFIWRFVVWMSRK